MKIFFAKGSFLRTITLKEEYIGDTTIRAELLMSLTSLTYVRV